MAADVVRPVGIADVGGGGGEPGLIGERIPDGDGVTGEADLVAVVAEATPAMEEEGAFALVLLVGEVDVVEPPGWVDACELGVALLLPVKPPEVDALFFERVVEEVEVVPGELAVGDVEGDVLLRSGVDAHVAGELRVGVFPGLNAAGGVEVEGGFEAFVVEFGEEVFGVGKEGLVPGVAAPALVVAGGIADAEVAAKGLVPVHVDDEDVEGDVVVMEAGDEVAQFLVAVGPVARPPGAEGVAGRQGDAPGDTDVVAQGCLVVVTVAEEVEVLAVACGALQGPGLGERVAVQWVEVRGVEKRAVVVEDDPAVTRDESLADGFPEVFAAACAIEGAGGAAEIAGGGCAGMPGHGAASEVEGDGKIRGSEAGCGGVVLVDEMEPAGVEGEDVAGEALGEVRDRQATVQDDEGGMIFILAVGCPFHADEFRCEHGEAGVACVNEGSRARERIGWFGRGRCRSPGQDLRGGGKAGQKIAGSEAGKEAKIHPLQSSLLVCRVAGG